MKTLILTIGILFLVASPTSGEIVEVPLINLHGIYTHDGIEIRSDSISLDRIPTEIHNVSLKLNGNVTNGRMAREFVNIGICFVKGLDWVVTTADTTTLYRWMPINYGSHLLSEEEMNTTFDICTNSSWYYLLSGNDALQLHVKLWSFPEGPNHCWWCEYPIVELSGVWLVIDATFETGLRHSSWGAIKALYK